MRRKESRGRTTPEERALLRRVDLQGGIGRDQMRQATGVVAMTVREHSRVEPRQIHLQPLDVVLEESGVVAGIEQDTAAAVLDQRGKPPVFLQIRRVAEGVVQHGHASRRLRVHATRPQDRQSDQRKDPERHRVTSVGSLKRHASPNSLSGTKSFS